MRRLRGVKALVHDAVDRTTALVEEGHESTARSVMRVIGAIDPLAAPARRLDGARRWGTRGLLGTIRAVNRAIEAVTDVGLDVAALARGRGAEASAVPMRSDVTRTGRWLGDAALGLVNGVIGDVLHARDNGLDLGMALRHGDHYLTLERPALAASLPAATPRLVIFVHGLATTEWCWCLDSATHHGDPAASFGSLLDRDLGTTSIFVRYNSGRHVSESGRTLARALQRLVDAYPIAVDEIILVGHSMGGLVIRSACHYAAEEGHAWAARVSHVFCLGSPHRGAPLAKLGHLAAGVLAAIDTPGTQIPARILAGRSAGIKDLRGGALVDEDWIGRDLDALSPEALREVPLLEHAAYHFISATITEDPSHPVGHWIGDLLVRTASAGGPASVDRPAVETMHVPIAAHHHGRVLHHQLQNHPAVYAQLLAACSAPARPA